MLTMVLTLLIAAGGTAMIIALRSALIAIKMDREVDQVVSRAARRHIAALEGRRGKVEQAFAEAAAGPAHPLAEIDAQPVWPITEAYLEQQALLEPLWTTGSNGQDEWIRDTAATLRALEPQPEPRTWDQLVTGGDIVEGDVIELSGDGVVVTRFENALTDAWTGREMRDPARVRSLG